MPESKVILESCQRYLKTNLIKWQLRAIEDKFNHSDFQTSNAG
jgi:hypothetical protein